MEREREGRAKVGRRRMGGGSEKEGEGLMSC